MSAASVQVVTVDFATANSTAVAPGDYTATSGTLTFAAGETTKTIIVPVVGDLLDEVNEVFFVNLSNATNITIGDNQGVGTITDDDLAPSLAINDVTVVEGNTGTTNATFTVTLSAASGQAITVNFATANNTALAPGDYTAASGTLTFAAGETTKAITVPVVGDLLVEGNETFFVNLTNAVNATISDNQGLGTITDDDVASLAINDVTVTEGNSGTTNATFTVTLSAASGQPVTVDFATANNTASAPGDYTATSGSLSFAAGETSKTITVPVIGDLISEGNETFFVNLTNATNASIADNQGIGTITNDDAPPL
jgi:subtilisin-like proprotein convertase family protein